MHLQVKSTTDKGMHALPSKIFHGQRHLVRKDMVVNEHERLSNITLRHKFKQRCSTFIAVLHFSHRRVFNNLKRALWTSLGHSLLTMSLILHLGAVVVVIVWYWIYNYLYHAISTYHH